MRFTVSSALCVAGGLQLYMSSSVARTTGWATSGPGLLRRDWKGSDVCSSDDAAGVFPAGDSGASGPGGTSVGTMKLGGEQIGFFIGLHRRNTDRLFEHGHAAHLPQSFAGDRETALRDLQFSVAVQTRRVGTSVWRRTADVRFSMNFRVQLSASSQRAGGRRHKMTQKFDVSVDDARLADNDLAIFPIIECLCGDDSAENFDDDSYSAAGAGAEPFADLIREHCDGPAGPLDGRALATLSTGMHARAVFDFDATVQLISLDDGHQLKQNFRTAGTIDPCIVDGLFASIMLARTAEHATTTARSPADLNRS